MDKDCKTEDSAKMPVKAEIQKRFLLERKIFLWSEVTDESAAEIVEKLLYLDMLDSKKEITFYLSTPGGSISAGMSIYDAMKLVKRRTGRLSRRSCAWASAPHTRRSRAIWGTTPSWFTLRNFTGSWNIF